MSKEKKIKSSNQDVFHKLILKTKRRVNVITVSAQKIFYFEQCPSQSINSIITKENLVCKIKFDI